MQMPPHHLAKIINEGFGRSGVDGERDGLPRKAPDVLELSERPCVHLLITVVVGDVDQTVSEIRANSDGANNGPSGQPQSPRVRYRHWVAANPLRWDKIPIARQAWSKAKRVWLQFDRCAATVVVVAGIIGVIGIIGALALGLWGLLCCRRIDS